MKTSTRKTLTSLMTLALVAGPLAVATADSDSNKGQLQRMMVGINKSCQVGELKDNEQGNNKNGHGEKKSDKSDKSSLTNQAQRTLEQLTKKNTTASLAAAVILRPLTAAYITNTAGVAKSYTDSVAAALTTCNNSIAGFKTIYEATVSAAKTALKTAQVTATTKEAKTAAQVAYKTAINNAVSAFKLAAQPALTKYQGDITAAQGVQKTALGTLNVAFTAAIQTARLALA